MTTALTVTSTLVEHFKFSSEKIDEKYFERLSGIFHSDLKKK
jgi:hypothetical protein